MKNKKMRPYTVMCTDIYLLVMLVIFPLYYADGYFHLPQRKAEFFSIATLIYIIVCALGVAIDAFSMRERWNLESFKKNITGTDICMFGFLVSNVIALTMSNDVATSWSGVGGRYYGAQVLILVCIAYFLVSRYAWINKVFIIAFLIAGNGVCLLATFDYFWLDVLGINQQMQEADWYVFISTMGNANTCASYTCMVIVAAMVYYCVTTNWKEKVLAVASIINSSVTLVTARSDSATLGVSALIFMLIILMLCKKIKWSAGLESIGILILGLIGFAYVREAYAPTIQEHRWYDTGIPRILWSEYQLLYLILVIVIVLYAVIFFVEKKEVKIKKPTIISLYIIGGLCVFVVAVFLIREINLLQVFKEAIGAGEMQVAGNRKYTYIRTIQAYSQLPFYHKVFGCGQATISSVLNQYYGTELANLGISINSAHNNILDYLIITGAFGVVCYLGIVVTAIKHGICVLKNNGLVLVMTGCIVAYFTQGLFNIEQTNTTTIFWMFIGLIEAVYRQHEMKVEKNSV